MTRWGARVLNFEAAHAAREHQVNVFVGAAHGPSRGTKVVRDAADNAFTINRIAAVRWVPVNGTLEADTRAWWRRLFEAGQWAAPRILYVQNGHSGFYLLVKEEVPATVITEVGGGRLQVEDPAYSAVTVTFAKPVAAGMSWFSRKLRSKKITVHSAFATAQGCSSIWAERYLLDNCWIKVSTTAPISIRALTKEWPGAGTESALAAS
jgi:aspartokinase